MGENPHPALRRLVVPPDAENPRRDHQSPYWQPSEEDPRVAHAQEANYGVYHCRNLWGM